MRDHSIQADRVAGALTRYGLVLVLGWIGLLKFTTYEAQGIEPLVANSPFMGWVYEIVPVTTFSAMLGVVEIATAVLLAVKPWWPRLSAVGSLMAIGLFVATVSFLFTTPGVGEASAGGFPVLSMTGQFLIKDVVLLGAAAWTLADALRSDAVLRRESEEVGDTLLTTMTRTDDDESSLVAALKSGDESAFAELVDRHTPAMLRVAQGHVASREIAEEVVQETWMALLKGISNFEGRSSLRTWLFTVLINIAKKRGVRDRRTTDLEVLAFTGGTVDPARFRGTDDPYPGHWLPTEVPEPFPETPEGSVLGDELVALATREIEKLPERQRIVVTMRDMLDLDSSEVCQLLDISMANQRVLLHRGRAVLRQALEEYLRETI